MGWGGSAYICVSVSLGGAESEMEWDRGAWFSVCVGGVLLVNKDLKNKLINKWSGGKQGSACHQKTPFICRRECLSCSPSLSLYLKRRRKLSADEGTLFR